MQLYKVQDYFHPYRILDIGANIGQFHQIAKQTFPEAYIFSVEASPDCEASLKQLTENYYIGLLAKDNSEYNFTVDKVMQHVQVTQYIKNLLSFILMISLT